MKIFRLFLFLILASCGEPKVSQKEFQDKFKKSLDIAFEEANNDIEKHVESLVKNYEKSLKSLKTYSCFVDNRKEGFICTIFFNESKLTLTEKNSLDNFLNMIDYKNNNNNIRIMIMSFQIKNFDEYLLLSKYFLNEYFDYVNIYTEENFNSEKRSLPLKNYKELFALANKPVTQK